MLITMPQLGETVTEGTIVEWFKGVGDSIAEDEVLFEVSTDKVDTEIPSPVAGIVSEILVGEGETVAVGTPLAVVTSNGVTDDDDTSTTVAKTPTATEALRPDADLPTERLEPAERTERLGLGAHVTRDDVAARLAARDAPLQRPAPRARDAVSQPRKSQPSKSQPSAAPVTAGDRDSTEPFTTIRRRTAEHMVRSLATSAHTLVVMDADFSAVRRALDGERASFRDEEGFGLTYLPFVARAVVDALSEFPRVNASVGEDALIVHRDVHLGIAVDLEFEGLVVPVIRHASELRVRALARAMHERSVAARERALGPDDLAGGTFTLTNAGGYGTLLTAPIISQPQVAIIATDGVSMRPVAIPLGDATGPEYGVAVHPIGNLAMSFDHRAFDGAYASAFLGRVVEILESRRWVEELA